MYYNLLTLQEVFNHHDTLIEGITDMLNIFPRKDSVAEDYSSAAIILGKPNIDYNIVKLDFGSYFRVYDGIDNTNKSRHKQKQIRRSDSPTRFKRTRGILLYEFGVWKKCMPLSTTGKSFQYPMT